MPNIRIPTPLRPFTGNEAKVNIAGATVGEVLTNLTVRYPELRQHIYDGDTLRNFVNVYLGEEDVRYLDGQATPLDDTDELRIIPSIAGGLVDGQ